MQTSGQFSKARTEAALIPDADAAREIARNFDLNHLSAEFHDDPYPTYRALREHDPVHRLPDGSYFLTRYDDLVEVYHNVDVWSSDKTIDFAPNMGNSLLYEHHTTSLVFNDPPVHTRVRKLLAPTFAPRALKALQPRIETLVDGLLDAAETRGEIDCIEDFAAAIPIQLIGDLLGVPHGERDSLRHWSLTILSGLEPVLTPETLTAGNASVADFKGYLTGLIARRSREGSSENSEILSKLIAASEIAPGGDSNADRLSELELLHNCIFLLNAGHETTTNLIGNGVDLLLRHPDALRDLAEHPELIGSAIEEFLRMESSNQLGNRRARRKAAVGDIELPAGSYVHLCIGAANRDKIRFPDPDRLDIRREPNRHLAFGSGIHACAGMSLARMEAQVAIGKLVRRFRKIERKEAPVRGGRARFRGFLHLPIVVER